MAVNSDIEAHVIMPSPWQIDNAYTAANKTQETGVFFQWTMIAELSIIQCLLHM